MTIISNQSQQSHWTSSKCQYQTFCIKSASAYTHSRPTWSIGEDCTCDWDKGDPSNHLRLASYLNKSTKTSVTRTTKRKIDWHSQQTRLAQKVVIFEFTASRTEKNIVASDRTPLLLVTIFFVPFRNIALVILNSTAATTLKL